MRNLLAALLLPLLPGTIYGQNVRFVPAQDFPGSGFHIQVVDFDADGKLDFIASESYSFTRYKGDGAGRFTALPMSMFFQISGMAVGDLNQDGLPEVVLVNPNENTGVIYVNGGNSFSQGSTFGTPSFSRSVAIGDHNGDGLNDILTTHFNGPPAIFLGNGTTQLNTFGAPLNLSGQILGAIFSDVNADGINDIIFKRVSPGIGIDISFGKGSGDYQRPRFFSAEKRFPSNEPGLHLAVADFNDDGLPDLWNNSRLMMQSRRNVFQALKINHGHGIAVAADFDADGKKDVLAVDDSGYGRLFLGNGSGGFRIHRTWFFGVNPRNLGTGDFNGDGKMDLVVGRQEGVSVFLNYNL